MRARWGVIIVVGLIAGCSPAAPVSLKIAAVVLPSLRLDPDVEQTSAEIAEEDAKRQNANEQTRLTGARLERERAIAEKQRRSAAMSEADVAPIDPYSPARLDASMIRDSIATVKPQVAECRVAGISGTVMLDVSVATDGHVRRAAVRQTPDPALGACVAHVLEAATFPKTQAGGSFRIPFVY